MVKRKKSKYKNAIINNKRYYFYSIRWVDITADGGHATEEEFEKMEPAIIVTHAYVFKRTNKLVYTFASYDEKGSRLLRQKRHPTRLHIKNGKDSFMSLSEILVLIALVLLILFHRHPQESESNHQLFSSFDSLTLQLLGPPTYPSE